MLGACGKISNEHELIEALMKSEGVSTYALDCAEAMATAPAMRAIEYFILIVSERKLRGIGIRLKGLGEDDQVCESCRLFCGEENWWARGSMFRFQSGEVEGAKENHA